MPKSCPLLSVNAWQLSTSTVHPIANGDFRRDTPLSPESKEGISMTAEDSPGSQHNFGMNAELSSEAQGELGMNVPPSLEAQENLDMGAHCLSESQCSFGVDVSEHNLYGALESHRTQGDCRGG
jgi:hypothetical protein